MHVEAERVRLTFHELSKSPCIVCGGSPITSIHLAGATSPSVRLCGTCAARDHESRRIGTSSVIAALLAVLIAGAAVATLDPQPRRHWTVIAWLVSAIVGFALVRRVRDRRLALAPFVVLAIEDARATFEVRRMRVAVGEAAYRSPDVSAIAASPHRTPPGDRSIAWFTFPVIVGGLVTIVAWRGANPVVLIHNPDSTAHTVHLDDAEIVMREVSHRWFRVHFGTHRFRIDDLPPDALRLGWNEDHAFAVIGEGCYADDVRSTSGSVSFRGTSYSWSHASHTYRGHWIPVRDARRTYPLTCRD